MKKGRIVALIACVAIMMTLVACSTNEAALTSEPVEQVQAEGIESPEVLGKIYLYGEQHGVEKILNKELEIWSEYYHSEGLRSLFIEMPYYTGELLNLWMQSDSDDILNALYEDWKGTASYNPYILDFYKEIKSQYPETVFHGTDVGHQYDTTGKRFLKYLEENGGKDSEQYLLAQEGIEQGKTYYKNSDNVYRENKMTENFIREYERLEGKSLMGIYGGAHTGLDDMEQSTQSVPCMANQLKKLYGEAVFSEYLGWLAKDIEPSRVDTVNIGGKDYEASYFGKQELTGFKDLVYREFWRLENAYDDFKDSLKTGDVLPYDNYPMLVEEGQIFIIDYTKTDGSVARMYYRSDGYVWNEKTATEEFTIE